MSSLNTGIDDYGYVWVDGHNMGNIYIDRSLTIKLAVRVYLESDEAIPSTYLSIAI